MCRDVADEAELLPISFGFVLLDKTKLIIIHVMNDVVEAHGYVVDIG